MAVGVPSSSSTNQFAKWLNDQIQAWIGRYLFLATVTAVNGQTIQIQRSGQSTADNTYYTATIPVAANVVVGSVVAIARFGSNYTIFGVLDTGHDFRAGGNIIAAGAVYSSNGVLAGSAVTLTNAAGASAGTLTNAPSAGNPSKWIEVNDHGTIRKIPSWT